MGQTLYVVNIEVEPRAEARWLEWQRSTHVPDVVRQPGFIRAQIYRLEGDAPDGWHRYVTQYDVETRAALEAYFQGEAVARLRADFLERFGSTTRLSRQVLEKQGEPLTPVR